MNKPLPLPRDHQLESPAFALGRVVAPAAMSRCGITGPRYAGKRWGMATDDQRALRRNLIISIVLAAMFLTLKIHEYAGKDYRWDSHPHGSIVWLIIGFHATHVVSLLLKTMVVCVLALRGFFTAPFASRWSSMASIGISS